MDIMMKIKGWAKGIADVGVSLIALGIVLGELGLDSFKEKTNGKTSKEK